MAINNALVKVTRAVHRAAVGLHLVGLRSAVQKANRREVAAQAAADRSDAVVSEAIKARAAARYAAGRANADARYAEFAARQEATNIGGKL